MSVIWPGRVTANPTLVQQLMRLVHWICAAVALYFIYRLFNYLLVTRGAPQWKEVTKFVALAAAFWLGGRGLRFVLGSE